jgi:hypothetical protein
VTFTCFRNPDGTSAALHTIDWAIYTHTSFSHSAS